MGFETVVATFVCFLVILCVSLVERDGVVGGVYMQVYMLFMYTLYIISLLFIIVFDM